MANERIADEPLSASIGEQLQEKSTLDQQLEAERQTAVREEERTERHKAKEREEVAKHLGEAATPEGWRGARTEARERGRKAAWLRDWGRVLLLPVAGAGGLVLGLLAGPRKKGMPVVIPVLMGVLVWRRVAHAR
jgi:hypothetical protein